MSYMKKCLAINSGLRCERSWWGEIIYYEVIRADRNEIEDVIGEGMSAAMAWRDAWEELNAKNKN